MFVWLVGRPHVYECLYVKFGCCADMCMHTFVCEGYMLRRCVRACLYVKVVRDDEAS
jgi:hypothetical protein